MAPTSLPSLVITARHHHEPVISHYTMEQYVVEAWAQGFNFGSLVILILLVLCNYRAGVFLHKLILLEVCLLAYRPMRNLREDLIPD